MSATLQEAKLETTASLSAVAAAAAAAVLSHCSELAYSHS